MSERVVVPRLCGCGKPLAPDPVGPGRKRRYCADCAKAAVARDNGARYAEQRASVLYCRFHNINAVEWLEGASASGEACPGGCGKACNNADGRRCAECEAR